MRGKVGVLFLILAFSFSEQAVGCTGCTPVYNTVDTASNTIDTYFDSAIDDIASKYRSDIVPMLEANAKAQKQVTILYKKLEFIEREMMYVNNEIVKITKEIKAIQRLGEVEDNYGRDKMYENARKAKKSENKQGE